MICPQCGYDMGRRSKCLRCGYEDKELAIVEDGGKQESEDRKKEKEEKPEVKIIDPCNVYLTHPYGVEDDDVMFGSPFSSIFDSLFGDPISDLLGGLFGINLGGPRRSAQRSKPEEPKRRRKQGPIVEIDNADVEILDENNNPIDKNKSQNRQQSRQADYQQNNAHKNDKHRR